MGSVAVLDEILGESPGVVALREQVARLLGRQAEGARRRAPILILGETGTGKGLLAGVLHRAGPRAAGPFVDVNCAAIPETLLEAELFGFERGAFTDARQAKPGLLQTAHGGLLFLDEVGLLPGGLQAKLLKVLEERVVRRLGSTRSEAVDVWVVAATSEDLEAATRAGRFREDLYHRLAVLTLRLPPLRERGADIVRLAEHFLRQACEDYGLTPRTLAEDARAALLQYPWPGNVRELANAMERVALLTDAAVVHAEVLALPTPAGGAAKPLPGVAGRPTPSIAKERQVLLDSEAQAERQRLHEVLTETRWNITRAASRLGIPRNTLRYRMDKHGLTVGAPARGAPAQVGASPPQGTEPAPAESASPGAAAPAGVRWEPRRIVFLRARLVGARAESGSWDTNRAMSAAVDKVQSFGGRVDELSPTGLVAVFGLAPIDDPSRQAAYAAMAMERSVERGRREDPARPGVSLALHTEFLPVGRHAHGADIDADARRPVLAALAALGERGDPGTVVVSAPLARLLVRRFELVALEPGPSRSGETYRLVGPGEAARGLVAFVGRESELRLLGDRFDRARAGHGQIVSIVGEPGIGKTRLLREFRDQLGGAAAWVEGQAISLGPAMPFHSLIDLLRRAWGIDEADPDGAVREKLARVVTGLGGDLAPTLPFLRYLFGLDPGDPVILAMDPEQRRRRVVDAVRRLVFQRAQNEPLVIVWEDAHWLDRATEDFVALLADDLATLPILMVVTARPGHPTPMGDRTYHTRLTLGALSTADSIAMACGLLSADSLSRELEALITARAEGNPFFLEELIHSLEETGGIRRDGTRLTLVASASALTVPATIQDVIQGRIDRLPEGARDVLQVASVLGKDVAFPLLAAVADVSAAALRDGLARLRAAELLYQTTAFPEIEYTFKHALTQEVAYGRLDPDRCRRLHAALVDAIERLHAPRLGEYLERLAHHAFRGEVWDRAARYSRQAGAKAFARSANREAVAWLEQAVTALAHLPETPEHLAAAVDARFELRTALFPLAELGRMATVLDEAEVLATRFQDLRRQGWVAVYRTAVRWLAARFPEAVASSERTLEIAASLGDFPLEVVGRYFLGASCTAAGDYRRGEEALRRTLATLPEGASREAFGLTSSPAIHARSHLSWCLGELGEFAEAVRLGEDGLRMADAIDHPFTQVSAAGLLASVYVVKGDLGESRHLLDRALALAREWALTAWAPFLSGTLGYVTAVSGEAPSGIAALEEALGEYDDKGLGFFRGLLTVQLGEAHLRAGQVDDAGRAAEAALAGSRRRGERGHEARALRLLGEVAARRTRPDVDGARRWYGAALALATQLGMRPLVAHCHLGLGRLHRRTADQARADEHLSTATAAYREMDMGFWLEQTEAESGPPRRRNSP
jgi:DNA-binding NtrC family response regulator/tetratricopeptide (TPR) repeat protein